MKKQIFSLLLVLAAIVGLSSCNKDDDNVVNNKETFVGTWYVTKLTGGIAEMDLEYGPDEVIVYFYADGKGKVVNNRKDGEPFASGTFTYNLDNKESSRHISTKCICINGVMSGLPLYYTFDGDKVYLAEDVSDGFCYTLKRK